jgi:uncharacterized protein YodC (DUF2158 family)
MNVQMTTSDFSIGDAVMHTSGAPSGVVSAHNHARGLIRIRWSSGVEEWLPPDELRPVKPRA